jgi:hypothetical protein
MSKAGFSRRERIAFLEHKMKTLFELPHEMMSDDLVRQYNEYEREWKELTRYHINN